MTNTTQELQLHDIKNIVEIPDYSIFIFSALLFLACLVLFFITIFIIKLIKNKKTNHRKEYLLILKNLDFKNPKQDAYIMTKYIRLLAKNEREIKLSEELIEELEKYKYKKEVDTLDIKIKAKLSTFMEIVDV